MAAIVTGSTALTSNNWLSTRRASATATPIPIATPIPARRKPWPMISLVTLPLSAGNLSNFDDRWGWIENDVLPNYQELLHDPHAARALISTPVADRAEDFRKLPDLPYPGG